jgi:hypothetical protein
MFACPLGFFVYSGSVRVGARGPCPLLHPLKVPNTGEFLKEGKKLIF